jgi:hypothetical protein
VGRVPRSSRMGRDDEREEVVNLALYPDWYLAFSAVVTAIVLIGCGIAIWRRDK